MTACKKGVKRSFEGEMESGIIYTLYILDSGNSFPNEPGYYIKKYFFSLDSSLHFTTNSSNYIGYLFGKSHEREGKFRKHSFLS